MKKIVLFVLLITAIGCKKEQSTPDPPLASFTGKDSPYLEEPVSFVSTSTAADICTWDFGDGAAGQGPSVLHAYTYPGSYTCTLTAKNAGGQSTASKLVTVKGGRADFNVQNRCTFGFNLATLYWDGSQSLDYYDHGYLPVNAITVTLPTMRDKVDADLTVLGTTYYLFYPWQVVAFTMNNYAIYDTTSVFSKPAVNGPYGPVITLGDALNIH